MGRTTYQDDEAGQRWCTACGKHQPLSAFSKGQRRYLCKSHVQQNYLAAHAERRRAAAGSPERCQAVNAAYKRTARAARRVFGLAPRLPWKQFLALVPDPRRQGVVPRVPTEALTAANAAVLPTRAAAEALGRLWAATRDAAVYGAALASITAGEATVTAAAAATVTAATVTVAAAEATVATVDV